MPEIQGYTKGAKIVGKTCAGVNILYSTTNLIYDICTNELTTKKAIKYGLDITVVMVSILVPGGGFIGAAYFIGDILTDGYFYKEE